MLEFFRDLRKSSEEKQQEALNAFLDDALTTEQQKQFKKELEQNRELQNQLQQMRALKQQMSQLPKRQVPRNFTLDPAAYGRPARQPFSQAYPILRTATVLTALIFIFVLAANVFLDGTSFQEDAANAPIAAVVEPEMEAAVEEAEELPSSEMEAASEVVEEEMAAPSDAEDAIGGEMEMPPEAQEAPLADEQQKTPPLLLTAEPADQTSQAGPEVQSTIIAEQSIEEDAAGATTVETETVPGLLPDQDLSNLEQPGEERLNGDSVVAYGLESDPFTVLLLILGTLFIILLVFTLVARRRL